MAKKKTKKVKSKPKKEKKMKKEQFESITKWQNETFKKQITIL